MRASILASCLILVSVSVLGQVKGSVVGQVDETDPYGVNTVEASLQTRSNGQGLILSITEKRLVRLGDRVSIALLKMSDSRDLSDAQRVRDFLPIVRDAFLHPELITFEADRKPQVTLFLLDYLRRNVPDSQVQSDIQQTVEFVKSKTAGGPS
jgi:hypothetical protein